MATHSVRLGGNPPNATAHSVLLPGKSHGWRSVVGYSPWGRKESDMTERLHFHVSLVAEHRPWPTGSAPVVHRLRCLEACGIFLD